MMRVTLAGTGDAFGSGADLFICECYMFERDVSGHLSYAAIMANYDRLGVGRPVLTHMGHDMLARLAEVDRRRATPAEDGMVIEL